MKKMKKMFNKKIISPKVEEQMQFYGKYYDAMFDAKTTVINHIYSTSNEDGRRSFEYCISRIKSVDSVKRKLERKGFEISPEAAIRDINDAVGVRIICGFLSDLHYLADSLKNNEKFKVVKIKDYITHPKENGYRSYHIVLKVETIKNMLIPVEIQIRTISQDAWANLEHKIKYKKEVKNEKLIREELKRCADEMASTDISMQTIKELIEESEK